MYFIIFTENVCPRHFRRWGGAFMPTQVKKDLVSSKLEKIRKISNHHRIIAW